MSWQAIEAQLISLEVLTAIAWWVAVAQPAMVSATTNANYARCKLSLYCIQAIKGKATEKEMQTPNEIINDPMNNTAK